MAKKPEPSENEATEEETVTVTKSQLATLLERIDKLETNAKAEIEISTDLPQAANLQPGQYVNIAGPSQTPDLRKVRWNRSTIEKTYPSVPLVPRINIVVSPHGIQWDLQEGTAVDVPSIVKDFHDAEVKRQKTQYDRYRPESAMEIIESIQRSKENPGVPVWGRPHIVGQGLMMNASAEPAAVPPPTETKP